MRRTKDSVTHSRSLDDEGLWSLKVGSVIGLVFIFVPIIKFLLHPLVTLLHEFGHTIFFWFFGYPAFPAFDFVHGGGVTIPTARSTLILLLLYVGLAALFVHLKQHQPTLLVPAGVFALVYLLLAWTPAHLTLTTMAGHLTTLFLATVFLYRGITGHSTHHSLERALYFSCSFYVYFTELAFAWSLASSVGARADYRHSLKCTVNDLVRVAQDLDWTLISVAQLYLLCCLAAPVAFWLWLKRRVAMRAETGAEPVQAVDGRLQLGRPEGKAERNRPAPDVWDGEALPEDEPVVRWRRR